MNSNDIALLELNGWSVDCQLPFELSKETGGGRPAIATGEAAEIILATLREESQLAPLVKLTAEELHRMRAEALADATTIGLKMTDNRSPRLKKQHDNLVNRLRAIDRVLDKKLGPNY